MQYAFFITMRIETFHCDLMKSLTNCFKIHNFKQQHVNRGLLHLEQ